MRIKLYSSPGNWYTLDSLAELFDVPPSTVKRAVYRVRKPGALQFALNGACPNENGQTKSARVGTIQAVNPNLDCLWLGPPGGSFHHQAFPLAQAHKLSCPCWT